jgi:hypothetical protein
MEQRKNKGGKGSPKQHRFGCKQKHGHSRSAYFSQAEYRIAANKRRRIEKEVRRQLKVKRRNEKRNEPTTIST